MKIKKIAFLIVAIMTTICLSGCANIEYIRTVDDYNVIMDKFVIELDESALNKAGYNMSSLLKEIEDDFAHFQEEVELWVNSFSDCGDLYQEMLLGIKVNRTPPIKNKISVAIEFGNWQMFGLFYGYASIEGRDYQKALNDVGPFIDKILADDYGRENYGLFLIKYLILKNNGIIDDIENFQFDNINYYEKYHNKYNQFDLEDLDIAQIFMFPDDRLYANADYEMKEGNISMFRWDMSKHKDGFEMEIFKLAPQTMAWYIVALVVSAIAVIIITLVIYKKSKTQIKVEISKKEVESDG